jgi:hypothetical protein
VTEFFNVAIALSFITPAVKILSVLMAFNRGVADGKVPDAVCGILVGQSKRTLAKDTAV